MLNRLYLVLFKSHAKNCENTQADGEESQELTKVAENSSMMPDTISHEEEAWDTIETHQNVRRGQVDQQVVGGLPHVIVC